MIELLNEGDEVDRALRRRRYISCHIPIAGHRVDASQAPPLVHILFWTAILLGVSLLFSL